MEYLISETALAYSIGALGYALFVASSYFRGRTVPLGFEAIGCVFVTIQWFMLGEIVTAAINFAYIYVAVCGILLMRFSVVKYLFPLVFPFILAAYMLYGSGSLVEVLAISASLPCLAARYLRDMNIIRGISLSSSVMWMVVNMQGGVVAGLMCNVGYGAGHVLYFIRKYREGKAVKALSLA